MIQPFIPTQFSRRCFVVGGLAGSAIGVALLTQPHAALAQGFGDLDILQFALTLEHLKARMYAEVLATKLFNGEELAYLESFASHEEEHVNALTETIGQLGAEPVQAQAAYHFPHFDSPITSLTFIKQVEETTVGAYQGAATSIQNNEILAAAGSILQAEARHAALINYLLALDPVPRPTTAPLTVDKVNTMLAPILYG